jgi:hypothetical protein
MARKTSTGFLAALIRVAGPQMTSKPVDFAANPALGSVAPVLRNFSSPDAEEPCNDKRCTKELCFERKTLQATTTREAAAKQERILSAKIWDIIRPIIRR